eukprot:5902548-Amphidinium_carterae.1
MESAFNSLATDVSHVETGFYPTGYGGGAATPLLMPADVCACGTVFVHDAAFCRRCGRSRPRVPSTPSVASSAIVAAAHLPRPPIARHRIDEEPIEEGRSPTWKRVPCKPWWHVPPVWKFVL